jgi:HEAT repeat protein
VSRTPADFLPYLVSGEWHASGGYWSLVRTMIDEVDRTALLEAANEWCVSTDNATRATGFDVLGELADDDESLVGPLLEQVMRAAVSIDVGIRLAAATALAYKDDDRVQALQIALLGDADEVVGRQVLYSLPRDADLPADHPIVNGLLRAMEHSCDEVRDWATFALGTKSRVDTPAVRDTFVRHLTDEGGDTAGEAARALGARKDHRVLPFLLVVLTDPDVDYLFVDAARELADPRLLPLLNALAEAGWSEDFWDGLLGDAIEACEAAAAGCRTLPPRVVRRRSGVTATTKVVGRGESGCWTTLRTSSRPGSRLWRSE